MEQSNNAMTQLARDRKRGARLLCCGHDLARSHGSQWRHLPDRSRDWSAAL